MAGYRLLVFCTRLVWSALTGCWSSMFPGVTLAHKNSWSSVQWPATSKPNAAPTQSSGPKLCVTRAKHRGPLLALALALAACIQHSTPQPADAVRHIATRTGPCLKRFSWPLLLASAAVARCCCRSYCPCGPASPNKDNQTSYLHIVSLYRVFCTALYVAFCK